MFQATHQYHLVRHSVAGSRDQTASVELYVLLSNSCRYVGTADTVSGCHGNGEEFNSTLGAGLDFVGWVDRAFIGSGALNESSLLHTMTRID